MTRGLWMGALALAVQGGIMVGTAQGAELDVAESADHVRPILIGSVIPNVDVKSVEGKTINLKAEISKSPTVLVFYRGGWCPYCNTQLKELKDAEPDLLKAGYQILAVSADRVEELQTTHSKHALSYRLYSDNQLVAAKAFGLAFRVDDATLVKYKGFGIDLEKASGEKHHLLPVPAVFVISRDGEIKFEYVNPNYKVRLKAEILIAAARAFADRKISK